MHRNKWTTYKNCNGVVSPFCYHLQTKHSDEYKESVHEHGLRKLKGLPAKAEARARELFTMEGFHQRLMDFIAVTDQVCILLFYFTWF